MFIYIKFIKSILKSLFTLAFWLALNGAINLRTAPFFTLNRIFSQLMGNFIQNNHQFYFKACFKEPIKIEENERQLLQLKANTPKKGKITN